MALNLNDDSTVRIKMDDYLKLVSAQIVLDVLKSSIKALKRESNKLIKNKTNSSNQTLLRHCSDAAVIEYVKARKCFSLKRWYCLSRPQYKYSCGISSLVSCWNYLYSTLGYGNLKPLSQEEAMNILGYSEPFDEIRFGPFTGNVTLMKWFDKLNKHFLVDGQASFFYKPVGSNRTTGVSSSLARQRLKRLLRSKDVAFIYHCFNHYCCPIGYESEPLDRSLVYTPNSNDMLDEDFSSSQNYAGDLDDEKQFVDWILIGDTSRKYPTFHSIKWEDINRDLNTISPEYINIRHLERGVQSKAAAAAATATIPTVKTESTAAAAGQSDNLEAIMRRNNNTATKNLHCIIQFRRKKLIDENENDFDSGSISRPKLESVMSLDIRQQNLFNDDDDDDVIV